MADERAHESADADRAAAKADRELQLEIAKAEREIHEHVQQLHDQGVIDLDAPARAVIDVIFKRLPNRPEASRESTGQASARAGGYWLVGDQGWCNHLT